jgi:hypothetical protein
MRWPRFDFFKRSGLNNPQMKLLISICLATFVALETVVAQQKAPTVAVQADTEPWQVVVINSVSLHGFLKQGTPFEVNIEAKKPKVVRGNYFGSVEQPSSVVTEIVVKLGGKKISFPKEAFEDLANASLQTVSVTSRPSGELKVRFTGGEEASRYEAEYFIQSDRLVKRLVSYVEATADGKKQLMVKTTTF